MKIAEAAKLKPGDLVIVTGHSKYYTGLVFEVEEITGHDMWRYLVTLKQPGFDAGFRLKDYDSRRLKRVEP